MTSVSIHEAEATLVELIHRLKPGDEILITENDQPVAKLIGQSAATRQTRRRGSAKGKLIIHSEDEEHFDSFLEYMP